MFLIGETHTIPDLTRFARKTKQISDGVELSPSIDNFLHFRRHDPEIVSIGKLAIARCILDSEAKSSLAYPETGIGFRAADRGVTSIMAKDTWISSLVKILTAGKDFNEFCRALSTVTFVCFNYDRCIERYLLEAVRLIYGDSIFDDKELLESLKILRPYGSLGDIGSTHELNGTFGKFGDDSVVVGAAKNIRTFTEGMGSVVLAEIAKAFSEAETAVFLGYGFISTNDDFLFKQYPFTIKSVFGTVYQISYERIESISDNIGKKCMTREDVNGGFVLRSAPRLKNETCSDLVGRYSHIFETIGV